MNEPVIETNWRVLCPNPAEPHAELTAEVLGACSPLDADEVATRHHCAIKLICCNSNTDEKVCGEPLVVFLPEPGVLLGLAVGVALLWALWSVERDR